MARAVASQIIAALGIEPSRPADFLPSQNPDLLRLEVAQAAAYWDVPNPIGRRDKKSGAKKRKQIDIERQRLTGT